MTDSSKLHLPTDIIPTGYSITDHPYFIHFGTTRNRYTNTIDTTGSILNFKIKQNEFGIEIMGSLAIFFFGSSQHTLTQRNFHNAIELLSEFFSLPIHAAQVKRLDMAENILVKHDVQQYFNQFLELSRFTRLPMGKTGLTYRTAAREICLYNKVKEQRKEKQQIHGILAGHNVLRVEVRWKTHSSLIKLLGMPCVTLVDVADNYNFIIKEWYNLCSAINKKRDAKAFSYSSMLTPTSISNHLKVWGIENIGEIEEFIRLIDTAKASGQLAGSIHVADNLKLRYRQLMLDGQYSATSQLSEEIDMALALAFFCNYNYEEELSQTCF